MTVSPKTLFVDIRRKLCIKKTLSPKTLFVTIRGNPNRQRILTPNYCQHVFIKRDRIASFRQIGQLAENPFRQFGGNWISARFGNSGFDDSGRHLPTYVPYVQVAEGERHFGDI